MSRPGGSLSGDRMDGAMVRGKLWWEVLQLEIGVCGYPELKQGTGRNKVSIRTSPEPLLATVIAIWLSSPSDVIVLYM